MTSPLSEADRNLQSAEAYSGAPGRLHPLSNLLGWNRLYLLSNLLEWYQTEEIGIRRGALMLRLDRAIWRVATRGTLMNWSVGG
jgi:hypothetical protein